MTRSGSEYIRGLEDGRAVYLDGERVEDVTTHPAFAAAVRSVARLFDLAHEPAHRDLMTFPSPRDGRPVNKSWLIPRTREDLVARRKAHKCWSDASYGLLGRSPDHVASFFAGYAGALSSLEKDQKRRRTRLARDSIDGVLLDLLSFCRDVVAAQTAPGTPLVNADVADEVRSAASLWTPESTLRRIDAIVEAREALAANAAPLLTLERMMMGFRTR